MRTTAGLAALLVLIGLAPAACRNGTSSGISEGDWVAFYTSPSDQSHYYYDRAGLETGSDTLQARWKRVNPRGAMSLYRIEIHCRARTFTERGTTLVEPDGKQQDLPKAELWTDHAIVPDSSTDVFARRFCPPA